jgi:hypothetical protein
MRNRRRPSWGRCPGGAREQVFALRADGGDDCWNGCIYRLTHTNTQKLADRNTHTGHSLEIRALFEVQPDAEARQWIGA